MMETMVEHVASVLGMAPDLVREVNLYKKGDTTLAGQYLEFCNVKEVLDSIKVHDAWVLLSKTQMTLPGSQSNFVNLEQHWV